MEQLAKSLLFYRKSRALRQQDVADAVHIAKQTYSNYERNVCEPDCGTLIDLANFYGISINQFLGAKNEDLVIISRKQYEDLVQANKLLNQVLSGINPVDIKVKGDNNNVQVNSTYQTKEK